MSYDPPHNPVAARRVTLDLAAHDAAILWRQETRTGDTSAAILRNALREYDERHPYPEPGRTGKEQA